MEFHEQIERKLSEHEDNIVGETAKSEAVISVGGTSRAKGELSEYDGDVVGENAESEAMWGEESSRISIYVCFHVQVSNFRFWKF